MDSSFHDKELAILREAVDKSEKRAAKKVVQSPEVKRIIIIVENFLRNKKLVCYGGTAINNILPVNDQFYDKNLEIPDYDFFSPNALTDAKELADLYSKAGYTEVEAKSGVHHGTYKVFVNYIPVADITYLVPPLFKSVSKESIIVHGIRYAPPNYLRMAMYLELSRPAGDVSRWEKVLKRLILLNNAYPMRNPRCKAVNFQRDFEEGLKHEKKDLYGLVRDVLVDNGVIFFGGYASTLYGRHMPAKQRRQIRQVPDFDVLAKKPEECAEQVKAALTKHLFNRVKVTKHDAVGEIIPPHYEVTVASETVCFIYTPVACHSYNTITIGGKDGGKEVNVATIDTILSFYLAFIYADRSYYNADRLLCMAQYLFSVQAKNRLNQKGLLKRFTINCYGNQPTLEDMRAAKTNKFEELKSKRGSKEWEEHFLKYIPGKQGPKAKKPKAKKPKAKKPNAVSRKANTKAKKTRSKTTSQTAKSQTAKSQTAKRPRSKTAKKPKSKKPMSKRSKSQTASASATS